MKPEDKIQEPLTVEVLQAYLQGTLSASQQEEVRQLVTENPFYQDALEGLKYVEDDYPLQETLADINSQIYSKGKSRERIIWLRPLAAAASIIVLLGVAYIIYVTTTRPDTETIYAEHYQKYPVTGRAAQESSASSLSFDSIEPSSEPTTSPPKTPVAAPKQIEVVEDEAEENEEADVALLDDTPREEAYAFSPETNDVAVVKAPPAPAVGQLDQVVIKEQTPQYGGNAVPIQETKQLSKTKDSRANEVGLSETSIASAQEATQVLNNAPHTL